MAQGFLTDEELAALPAKSKKHPEVVKLYQENDFLTAYARHTDLRVAQDGPEGAIGAVADWERHGNLQRDFLVQIGLKPKHDFLELGCGTGRLARKIVPYLDEGHYYGVDISPLALSAAIRLSETEGWAAKRPRFGYRAPPDGAEFDVIWAFSVFIHLPSEEMFKLMADARDHLKDDGVFYFSFVPEKRDERAGLKQFRHTLLTYTAAAMRAGFTVREVLEWPGEQKIAEARLA